MDEAMGAKVQDFESSDLPEPTKVALRFMEAWMLQHARRIDDTLFGQMRAHFSPAQIVELTSLAGIYESVHKFNHLFELSASEGTVGFGQTEPPASLKAHFEQLKAKRGKSSEG